MFIKEPETIQYLSEWWLNAWSDWLNRWGDLRVLMMPRSQGYDMAGYQIIDLSEENMHRDVILVLNDVYTAWLYRKYILQIWLFCKEYKSITLPKLFSKKVCAFLEREGSIAHHPTVKRGIRLWWSFSRTPDSHTYCREFGSGAVITFFTI